MKLLLIPGHRTWAEHPRMKALAQRLRSHGHDVDVFDPHWPVDADEVYRIIDVRTHLDAVKKHLKRYDEPIIAIGHSQAGAIVCRLAADGRIAAGVSLFGVTECEKRPQRMRRQHATTPFTDQDGIRWRYTEEFYDGYTSLKPLEDCSRIEVPMLFLAGTKDERVPLKEVRAGYEAAGGEKTFTELVCGHLWERDHGALDQIEAAITAWVEKRDR